MPRWVLALALLGCVSPKAPTGTSAYEYDVEFIGKELRVVASFPAGSARALTVDRGALRYVEALEIDTGDGFVPAKEFSMPPCTVCRLRYRFALDRASEDTEDEDIARRTLGVGDAYLGAPSSWLLYPETVRPDAWVRYRVRGASFLSGHRRDGDQWIVAATSFAHSPTAIVGDFDSTRVGTIDLAMPRGSFDEKRIERWVAASSDAVSSFYGRFPIDRVLVVLEPRDHARVGFGRTMGNGGASIVIDVGRNIAAKDLDDDWVLPHELLHLGFPRLARAHRWLEEGMATYAEPIARLHRGRYDAKRLWADLVEGLPHGLPREGDQGLDRTHTWGRTYWGGALYCLLADIEIHERTHNERSLEDALRAIRDAGGDVTHTWPIEKVLAVGDAGTGTTVLRELYDRMANEPMKVDLDDLWRRLGVRLDGENVTFDDGAELAAVRRAIGG